MKALFEMLVACCAFINLCVFEAAEGGMLLVFIKPLEIGKGDIDLLKFDLDSAPDYLRTLVKFRVGTGTFGLVLLRLDVAPSSASL